eukprot:scaffold8178_cov296-Pinguiococcus_pyrenoidosus.AAC.1
MFTRPRGCLKLRGDWPRVGRGCRTARRCDVLWGAIGLGRTEDHRRRWIPGAHVSRHTRFYGWASHLELCFAERRAQGWRRRVRRQNDSSMWTAGCPDLDWLYVACVSPELSNHG